MSRAADDKLFIAPLSKGLPQPRPVSVLRVRRSEELFLLWHLAFCLLLEWRARLDPIATFSLVLDLGGGGLTAAERADLLQELRQQLADPEPLETTAILDAAGRWFCRLELPKDDEELMGERPLHLRVGSRSKAIPLGSPQIPPDMQGHGGSPGDLGGHGFRSAKR